MKRYTLTLPDASTRNVDPDGTTSGTCPHCAAAPFVVSAIGGFGVGCYTSPAMCDRCARVVGTLWVSVVRGDGEGVAA